MLFSMRTTIFLLFIVSCFSAAAHSQNSSLSMDYFCTRLGHTSMQRGKIIYIYGGIRSSHIFNGTYACDESLVKLDMSSNWSVLYGDQPISLASIPSASSGPPSQLLESSIFFGIDDSINIYGGATTTSNTSVDLISDDSPVQDVIWTLPVGRSTWEQSNLRLAESGFAPMLTMHVQVPEHDLFFLFNGVVNNCSASAVNPKMTILNTRTGNVRIVSTESIATSTVRVGASIQYLPLVGKKGALILMGGETRHNDNNTVHISDFMAELNSIYVFDIASLDTTPDGIWYQQRTSGRTPKPRILTCATSVSSPDNTNYHIYISSGRTSQEMFDDVWVLSIPQFRWVQLFAGKRLNYGSTCHLVGKKQMIMIGGRDTNTACGVSSYVELFDITNLKWLSSFVADDKDFRVPKAIWETINGSGMGEATIRQPEGGFSNPGLAEMFNGMNAGTLRESLGTSRVSKNYYKRIVMVVISLVSLCLC